MGKLRELWLRWKMLRLPGRKDFLVGQDLVGNTYWEFKDPLNPNRFRRRIEPVKGRNTHMADLQVSPLWHQWLRHTRANPPSLKEQTDDVTRQILLKQNARLADERWARKAPYIQPPTDQHTGTQTQTQPETDTHKLPAQTRTQTQTSTSTQTPTNPGADFQPAAWVPGAKTKL